MYSRIHVSVPGMTACIGFCPWYHQMTCRAGRRDGSVKNSTGESAAALPHRSYHFTGEIPDRWLLEINEGAIPRSRRLHGIGAVHNVNSGKPCLDFFHKKRGCRTSKYFLLGGSPALCPNGGEIGCDFAPSLINTVHSQTSLSACLISNCFVFNH